MRKVWFILAVGLLGIANPQRAQADEQQLDEIIWAVNVSPPFFIVDGEYAGQGFCDVLVDKMQQQLSNVSHTTRRLPPRRITLLMKREKNLCFPCLIKRASYNNEFNYTDTTHLYPPHGIIAHADAAALITERYGNPASFTALADDQQLRFAQPIERRYGKLQPLLEEHLIGRENYRIVTGDNAHVNLMTMLLNQRVDYTIDYRMVQRFYEETHPHTDEQLVFIPIKEHQGYIIEGAIGCSDNAWGKAAAQKLNGAIESLRADSTFQQTLDKWLGENRPK
ncbi:MAG: hypothetical protein ACQEQ8_04905 [Pseudomonadota bacterium]